MSSWRRPTRPMVRRAAYGLVLALILGIGGPLSWDYYEERRARCSEGVVERGSFEECVGVTDGRDKDFAFAPHLEKVQRLIGAENKKVVEGDAPYTTIAYLTSFTLEEDDSNSAASVRRELQGAYLAQHRANRGDFSGSQKIRLLVANNGSNSGQWKHTVDELIELSRTGDEQERLLAVAGLGPSTEENRAALRKLSKAGVAMVVSNMTATNLGDIEGMARVSPTNADEARAASEYLKDRDFKTAVIVQDEAERNLYARTLAKEFADAFPDKNGHRLLAETSGFDTSKPGSWENELYWISRTLCGPKPDVIYFAGRGKHLMSFINALANRTCQKHEFTVMTGDDTTNLTTEELRTAAGKGIEVLYTGLAHPDMWEKDKSAVSAPSAAYFLDNGWMEEKFPRDPRTDGQAMVSHDAVLTAVQAIRMASHDSDDVTGTAVGRMFQQMRGEQQQVPGASGFLSFHNSGDPIDKAIPVLKLDAEGHFQLDTVVRADSGEG